MSSFSIPFSFTTSPSSCSSSSRISLSCMLLASRSSLFFAVGVLRAFPSFFCTTISPSLAKALSSLGSHTLPNLPSPTRPTSPDCTLLRPNMVITNGVLLPSALRNISWHFLVSLAMIAGSMNQRCPFSFILSSFHADVLPCGVLDRISLTISSVNFVDAGASSIAAILSSATIIWYGFISSSTPPSPSIAQFVRTHLDICPMTAPTLFR